MSVSRYAIAFSTLCFLIQIVIKGVITTVGKSQTKTGGRISLFTTKNAVTDAM